MAEASRIRFALGWVEIGASEHLRIVAGVHHRDSYTEYGLSRGRGVEAALAKVMAGLAELTDALNRIDPPEDGQ